MKNYIWQDDPHETYSLKLIDENGNRIHLGLLSYFSPTKQFSFLVGMGGFRLYKLDATTILEAKDEALRCAADRIKEQKDMYIHLEELLEE